MLAALLPMLMGDSESMEATIKDMVAKYKPLIYTVVNEAFGVYRDLAANDEWFAHTAKMKMNAYKSLVEAGFTSEQAMAFLLNSDETRAQWVRKAIDCVRITAAHD